MKSKRWLWIGLSVLVVLAVLVGLTAALTPGQTHPAFAAAVDFANAAGKGDDAAAFALLDEAMQTWVTDNCPDGSVSACVRGYTPREWGGLMSAVFRRAAPDGDAWDVDVIATYERDKGFSGVCIYTRVEPDGAGAYRIAGYAGYISCGDPASRGMAANPDAPNRAP